MLTLIDVKFPSSFACFLCKLRILRNVQSGRYSLKQQVSSVKMYSCCSCFVFRQKSLLCKICEMLSHFLLPYPGFLSFHPLIFWLFPGTVLTSFSRYCNKRSSKFVQRQLMITEELVMGFEPISFQVSEGKTRYNIIWYKLTFFERAYCMHSLCAALCLNLVLLCKSWSLTHVGK